MSTPDSPYVANGGDGSVRVLRGDDLAPIGRIELGDDADNVQLRTTCAIACWSVMATAQSRSSIRQPGARSAIPVSRATRELSAEYKPARQNFINMPDVRAIEVAGGPGRGDQPIAANAGRQSGKLPDGH